MSSLCDQVPVTSCSAKVQGTASRESLSATTTTCQTPETLLTWSPGALRHMSWAATASLSSCIDVVSRSGREKRELPNECERLPSDSQWFPSDSGNAGPRVFVLEWPCVRSAAAMLVVVAISAQGNPRAKPPATQERAGPGCAAPSWLAGVLCSTFAQCAVGYWLDGSFGDGASSSYACRLCGVGVVARFTSRSIACLAGSWRRASHGG